MRSQLARLLAAVGLVAILVVTLPANGASAVGGAGGAGRVGAGGRLQVAGTYRPPTTAPVVDGFRPPPLPWVAGNRGIEYATTPGSPVGAIGSGAVAFAGPVAGRLVVTVVHGDGLRSSYVGLATVSVGVGAQVVVGQPVGTSADRLHLGVRRGTTYLDPASLWGASHVSGRSVLVPGRRAPRPLATGSQVARSGSWPSSLLARSPWWVGRTDPHLG